MKRANDGQPWSPLGLGNPSTLCLHPGDRQGDRAGKSQQRQGKAVVVGMEGTGKGRPRGQRRLVEAVTEGKGKGCLVVVEVSGKGQPSWGQGGTEGTAGGHPGGME